MLIVRTQDLESIGKYAEIKVDECMVKGISVAGTMTVLGAYESRERAIKVVDYMHSLITDGTKKDYLDKNYRITQDVVFKMPQK